MIKPLLITLLTVSGFAPSMLCDALPSMYLAFSTKVKNPPKSDYEKQKELEVIDNEIESLTNLRDYYSSKMTRYRNRAMRYELQDEESEESKILFNEADQIEGVVKQIDEELARLEKEREDVLKS